MSMNEKSRPKAATRDHVSTDCTRIAVVIPALNEESSIGLVINAIPRPLVAEIIVVDNGSTDSAAAVARDSGAIVLFESRKGYGYACLAGIDHAVNNGAEIIVFLDGDFSDYPEELPMLVRPIIE
jgi:glycosyltransferase involved in cell wall biosynthesis